MATGISFARVRPLKNSTGNNLTDFTVGMSPLGSNTAAMSSYRRLQENGRSLEKAVISIREDGADVPPD
jgi:hypothetical protein